MHEIYRNAVEAGAPRDEEAIRRGEESLARWHKCSEAMGKQIKRIANMEGLKCSTAMREEIKRFAKKE